jgi:hypothetical protein
MDKIFALSFLLSIGAACTFNKGTPEQGAVNASMDKYAANSRQETYEFSKDENWGIYESMLAAEKQGGEALRPDQVHATSGFVSCRRDGALTACFFQTHLAKAKSMSSRERISRVSSDRIWEFYSRVRPDAKNEAIMVGDLNCDYLGKNSPPFGIEFVECKIRHPRLSNEVILTDSLAENFSLLLAEEIPLNTGTAVVSGSVLCQRMKGSDRTPCSVRPLVKGILREKFLPIQAEDSAKIGGMLMNTFRFDAAYRNDVKIDKIELPAELMGSATCNVDATGYKESGRRHVVCRIGI